jgi:hypothetical protein
MAILLVVHLQSNPMPQIVHPSWLLLEVGSLDRTMMPATWSALIHLEIEGLTP